jgi:hypothetical protein
MQRLHREVKASDKIDRSASGGGSEREEKKMMYAGTERRDMTRSEASWRALN